MANTLPDAFWTRIQSILPQGIDLTGFFQGHKFRAFRVNTLKITPQEAGDVLKREAIEFEPINWYPSAFTVQLPFDQKVLESSLAIEGKVYAQGLESMLSVLALEPQPYENIIDMCAAPGCKTTQIAAHMHNEGFLQANEPVKARFYRLKAVTDLLGAKVQLSMKDGRFFRSQQLFDRILVDAPCSSEGRFLRTEPKTYAYWSLRKIQEMAHKQKGLLLNAARLVKPGGTLVYSTCTFAPEENEAVIDWFLRKSEGEFSLCPIDMPFIKTYPALTGWNDKPFKSDLKPCLRVLPGDYMEGFFVAKLMRAVSG